MTEIITTNYSKSHQNSQAPGYAICTDNNLLPLPTELVGQQFLKYFNHPWRFIHAKNPAPGERPQWQTENRYPLQPRNLWNWHQNPDSLIGLRFGKETRYALLDIDAKSPYHPNQDERAIERIEGALEDIGLCRSITIRSSDSGGIHLYFFLPTPVQTFGLACALKFALLDANLTISQGQLETFPNCKAFSKSSPTLYNGHRLPLQPQSGSFILSFDFTFQSESLTDLLDQADMTASRQDMEALEAAIIGARKRHKAIASKESPGDKAEQWKKHLENRISEGWTGDGQTNELLKDFGQYARVFLGLGGQALAQQIEKTARAAVGFAEWCGHLKDLPRRAMEWAKACEKWWTPYCSYPDRKGRGYQQAMSEQNLQNFGDSGDAAKVRPINSANSDRREAARKKIQEVVGGLLQVQEGNWAASTTAERIKSIRSRLGRISLTTLYKHRDLWHPAHFPIDKENLISEKRISGGRIAISSSYECSSEKGNSEFSESTQNLHIEGVCVIPSTSSPASIPTDEARRELHTPPEASEKGSQGARGGSSDRTPQRLTPLQRLIAGRPRRESIAEANRREALEWWNRDMRNPKGTGR